MGRGFTGLINKVYCLGSANYALVMTCSPRTDPVFVLDFRLNLHKGKSNGQEDILPGTDRQETA